MKRRILSTITTLALVLSLCPVRALAEEGPIDYGIKFDNTAITSENAAEKLGDGVVSYDTDSKTVTLEKDFTINRPLEISQGTTVSIPAEVTLDNNGHLTNNGVITNDGTLRNPTGVLYNYGTLHNNGSFVQESGTVYNGMKSNPVGTIINTGAFTTSNVQNYASITNTAQGLISNQGGISNYLGSVFQTEGAVNGTVLFEREAYSYSRVVYGDVVYEESFTSTVGEANGRSYKMEIPAGASLTLSNGAKLEITGITADQLAEYLQVRGTLSVLTGGTLILPAGTTPEQVEALKLHGSGGTVQIGGADGSGNAPTVCRSAIFKDGDGTVLSSVYVVEGATVARPANPSRSGYVFEGWYKESSCATEWDFDTDTITGDTDIYAKWKPVYLLTVNGGTGGGEYEEGAAVAVTARIPGGKRFTGWTVNEGGVTLDNASNAATTLTMPARAVTITANFEDIPTYLVTVNGGTGGGSYTAGATVTITATAPEGKQFTVWTVDEGGATLADASSATTTFTMPAQAVTVTANFEDIPASTCLVTVTGGTGGGEYEEGATVTITATVPGGKRFTGWTVDEGGVTLADANSATTTFTMPAQAVTITANFKSIPSGGGSSGGSSGGGSSARPTYPPTVVQPGEGGGVTVSTSRPERGDKVTVNPKPEDGYEVAGITVTDQNGKPVEVRANSDGTYSFVQPSGKVKIEVSYKPVEPVETEWRNPFTDISQNDWYYDAVRYVQENGLMGGYGSGLFGPNDTLSRAQLAQILYNKEGRPVVSGSAFDDVDSGAWCAGAITWVAQNGIASGYGDGMFGPNDPITREQLAAMLWRYAGSPAATNKELHFNDTDEISGYALNALRWAVENGVLNGYGDGRLGPKGQATRAQAAQMLTNYLRNQ